MFTFQTFAQNAKSGNPKYSEPLSGEIYMSAEINRPSWVTNEASWRKQHKRMIARAYDLIHGRMDLVEAARELQNYKFQLRLESDNNFSVFKAICSETAHLPTDKTRHQYWDKEALAIKDRELRIIETRFRDQALEAARNIVAQYEPTVRPQGGMSRRDL